LIKKEEDFMRNNLLLTVLFLFFSVMSVYAQFKLPKYVPFLKKSGRYVYATYGDMKISHGNEFSEANLFDTISNKAIVLSYYGNRQIIDDNLTPIFSYDSYRPHEKWIYKTQYNEQVFFEYGNGYNGGIINSFGAKILEDKNNDDRLSFKPIGENRFSILSMSNQRYGIVDVNGNEILPTVLESISNFHEGMAAYNNGKYCGYLDSAGNEIIKAKYERCGDFINGIAEVDGNYINKKGGNINLFTYLKTLTGSTYFQVFSRSKDLLIVLHSKTDKSYDEQILFLDNKLKKVSNFIFQRPKENLNNTNFKIINIGVNSVSYEQEYQGSGILNFRSNKIVVKPKTYLNKIDNFSDGLYSVQTEDGWGFIDENGNIVIQPKYYKVYPFRNGYAFVKNLRGWFIINKSGNLVLPLYDYSEDQLMDRFSSVFVDGLIKIKFSYNKVIYIDFNGREYMEK
jgi:hypothetical protein